MTIFKTKATFVNGEVKLDSHLGDASPESQWCWVKIHTSGSIGEVGGDWFDVEVDIPDADHLLNSEWEDYE